MDYPWSHRPGRASIPDLTGRKLSFSSAHSLSGGAPTTVTELLHRLWATQPTSVTAGPASGLEIPSIATHVGEIPTCWSHPIRMHARSAPAGSGLIASKAAREACLRLAK
jgi:hypothetical protein